MQDIQMKIAWKVRVFGLLAVACLTILGLATRGVAQSGAGSVQDEVNPFALDRLKGPVDLGLTDPALVGAIDVHTHLEPTVPRSIREGGLSIDWFDFAKLAKARGLRGFVQKSHSDMTSAGNAYMVRTHVAPDLEVFGRMALNLSLGGINVAAVEHFSQVRGGWGRIIEMPTWDAEFRVRRATEEGRPWMRLMPPDSPKFVAIARNGELLPEVKYLIGVMAKIRTADSNGRLVLATGHSSGEEDVLLAREARKAGLQVVSPHGAGDMSPAQLQEFVKLGGFVEIRNSAGSPQRAAESAELVRKIGAGSIIVSSDCGFMNYPLHTDCLALIAQALRAHGITERELDLMFKENPAKLLGLPTRRTAVPSSAAIRP